MEDITPSTNRKLLTGAMRWIGIALIAIGTLMAIFANDMYQLATGAALGGLALVWILASRLV